MTAITPSFTDVLKVPIISSMKGVFDVSRDGKSLLYSSNETGRLQLYCVSAKPGSEPIQLTRGKDPVDFGLFSPNGREIVFCMDTDGNDTFHMYLIPVEGGRPRRITTAPQRMWGTFDWNPNGREVTRTVAKKDSCGLETVNLVTGECFMLKEPTPPIGTVRYSHDGKYIACDATVTHTSDEIQVFKRDDPCDMISYSIRDDSIDNFPCFSPDDKRLAFSTDANGSRQIVIQDFHNESRQYLELAEGEEVLGQPVWGPKGDEVYYLTSKHSRTVARKHRLGQGRGADLPFPEGWITSVRVNPDGSVAALHSSMTSPPAIYLLEHSSKQVMAMTPHDYGFDLAKLARPESVWYKSFDGREVHAWYLPAASKTPPYPAVVWVHGAGWQVSDSWNSGKMLHCLSLSGLAVIAPNFRGSTGYGSEFMKSIVGDPGGGDLNDVLSAAEWLRGRKDIQGTKIAVGGGSYGGYLALMALTTKPDAFAAGVSVVPVTDWLASIRLSDAAFMSFYQELWGGLTASKEGLIRSRSPITHVSKIKAPVLIKGAETDVRCPIQPIKEFVKELKKMGHPHEFILEKKEGHMSTAGDLRENIREVTSVISFLEENLT